MLLAEPLLARSDAQRLHLSIEVAAFKAKEFCGAADVIFCFFKFFLNVIAFVSVARLLQRGPLFDVLLSRGYLCQGRKMFALDAQDARIEDEYALDEVAQFTHVSRPVMLCQGVECLGADVHARTSVLAAKLA
uniref:Uncharacterized protein n=1 Tax=mine drainage metagenome TaxID=410659 RepID=E6QJT7_9ZZZZ